MMREPMKYSFPSRMPWVTQFAGQIEDGELIGPNAKTQEAYWRDVKIVTAMPPELRYHPGRHPHRQLCN